jgi:hypothetical protein
LRLDRDDLLASVNAFENAGRNYTQAAEKLGIARSTLKARLALAAQLGIGGFENILPAGMMIEGSTIQHDGEGSVKQAWTRVRSEGSETADVLEAIENVLGGSVREIPHILQRSGEVYTDLLTLYPIIDHHLGLYAWEPEAGANYDINIAQSILRDSLATIVADTPPSKWAIVLNIGDFFHRDNNRNRTDKSGNVLDGDGRYAKVLEVGVDLMANAIELALSKHECVEYRGIPGNHDEYSTVALNMAMQMAFKNNPRVHISRDPSHFYFKRFGRVMIGAAHGDFTKPENLPSIMAAYSPEKWGTTLHRYAIQGHVHTYRGGERLGVKWETFRTLAARDAWATNSGYAAGRGMTAITYHKETGEKYRHIHNISGKPYKENL